MFPKNVYHGLLDLGISVGITQGKMVLETQRWGNTRSDRVKPASPLQDFSKPPARTHNPSSLSQAHLTVDLFYLDYPGGQVIQTPLGNIALRLPALGDRDQREKKM